MRYFQFFKVCKYHLNGLNIFKGVYMENSKKRGTIISLIEKTPSAIRNGFLQLHKPYQRNQLRRNSYGRY